MTKCNSRIERYEGAMLGVAIGDALGAPLEFMSAREIRNRYGTVREMIGGGWLDVMPGEVTDDTQMTLAVAEGLSTGKNEDETLRMVGTNFVQWYRTAPKDVGGTCRAVLSKMNQTNDLYINNWHKTAKQVDHQSNGRTAGNGALMRAVYPALYYKRDKALDIAESIAKMTHWNSISTKAVIIYTDTINAIVNADDMDALHIKELSERLMTECINVFGKSCANPTGYSLDSLVCAINAVCNTDSFEEALVCAVNLGGDADTIGAITGGLAGAIYGTKQIPLRWINALANNPNRRTVNIFHNTRNADQQENTNTLAIRLIDLANEAFKHHEKI